MQKITGSFCGMIDQVLEFLADYHPPPNQSEFNCQECDFQAGNSQIILSKHMNLRHRNESQQSNDTLKCDKCHMQFSFKWTFYNHHSLYFWDLSELFLK